MYNNFTPLTQKQSDFAADNHALVIDFLIRNGHAVDEYYDIAVFGYINAVRMYHEYAELQEDDFQNIAFRYMTTAILNHFQAERQKTAGAVIISFAELRSQKIIDHELRAHVA